MVRLSVPLALACLACGDSVTYIECPPGTTPQGSECVPNQPPDATEVTFPDAPAPDDSATAPDTAPPQEVVTDSGPEVGPDTAVADTAEPAPTGSACVKNADCAGGTCLDWSGGYCTQLDCDAGAVCGDGDTCLQLAGNHLCVAGCQSDADCRVPDQRCKRLVAGGDTVSVCIGIDAGAGETGSACADATDCAGGATCLAAFPGGYCAALGCDVEACPAGASCVKVDGRPSCLLRCAGDGDCGGEPGAERRCGVLQSLSGAPVDVCISGIEGKALSESCRSDFECTSGTCQILGEGRCSQTGGPCFTDTVASDCNGAEFCQVAQDSRVGLCSQPCALGGRTCPGAAHCLAEGDSPRDAWCRPACVGPEDQACNADAGLACIFGIPISDSGQGRYACARTPADSTFTACNGDAACGAGGAACLLGEAGGYCSATCGEDGHCAFGGVCVFGASERCQRACLSGEDCPTGFSCKAVSGASRNVCAP